MLKDGFYPALGTPIDAEGNFLPGGMRTQVDMLCNAGASGFLAMGTMGCGPCVKDKDFAEVAKTTIDAAAGRAPVFVGCMDNSIARVKDKFDALKGLKVDAVVMTTPYYFITGAEDTLNFFRKVCAISPFPVYLYDLPVTTKIKITYDMCKQLMELPQVMGIKGGDLAMQRDIMCRGESKPGFEQLYSGTEQFDVAYKFGLTKQLDGFYCCIPKLTKRFYTNLANSDWTAAAKDLDNLNDLRNYMFGLGMFPAFTVAMNALGCEGIYHPDYYKPLEKSKADQLVAKLKEMGEV